MDLGGMYFSILLRFALVLPPSYGAIDVVNSNYYSVNVNESFVKTISHHYCNYLAGTHIVLLAEKSPASFYKILLG